MCHFKKYLDCDLNVLYCTLPKFLSLVTISHAIAVFVDTNAVTAKCGEFAGIAIVLVGIYANYSLS